MVMKLSRGGSDEGALGTTGDYLGCYTLVGI
jgi:hypothetical protein